MCAFKIQGDKKKYVIVKSLITCDIFFYINTKCIHIRSSLRSRHPQGFKSVQNKIKLCFTGA